MYAALWDEKISYCICIGMTDCADHVMDIMIIKSTY